jgi:hypothetical protein
MKITWRSRRRIVAIQASWVLSVVMLRGAGPAEPTTFAATRGETVIENDLVTPELAAGGRL